MPSFDRLRRRRSSRSITPQTFEYYDYDAYGEAFAWNLDDPSVSVRPSTDLLYAGEQWDADLGMQYLRARYYLPAQGIFNRLDPFFGNLDDPQSLHKYAYTHGDPVNGIDPSGLYSVIETIGTLSISTVLLNTMISGFTLFKFASNASSLVPSGFIITVSFGVAARGFGGALTLSIYIPFGKNTSLGYVVLSAEAGIVPISVFSNRRGIDSGIVLGFVFGLENPYNLKGASVTAAWPQFLFTSPFIRTPMTRSSWWSRMMHMSKLIKNRNSRGSLLITNALGGVTVMQAGPWSHTFGTFAGYTFGVWDIDTVLAGAGDLLSNVPDYASDIIHRALDSARGIGSRIRDANSDDEAANMIMPIVDELNGLR